jgi:hypothetical protein
MTDRGWLGTRRVEGTSTSFGVQPHNQPHRIFKHTWSQEFARVQTQVTREIVLRGAGLEFVRRTPGINIARSPLEYAFLIDRSGSMYEASS